MSKLEIQRLLAALASPETLKADAVTRLDGILNVSSLDKENRRPIESGQKKSVRTIAIANGPKGPKESQHKARSPKEQSPIAGTAVKERQQLATEVVNKTLKILTDAAKGSHNESRRGNSAVKCSTGGKPPAEQSGCLSHVASCARTAFRYLRHARDQSKSTTTLQLEQGMIALIGKLIALDLYTHAKKELAVLKSCLGTPPGAAHSGAANATSYDLSVAIQPKSSRNEVIKLCIAYQGLAVHLLDRCGSAESTEAACEILDPEAEHGPYSLIMLYGRSGASRQDIEKALSSLAKALSDLMRPTQHRHSVSAETILRLGLYTAYVRGSEDTANSTPELCSVIRKFDNTSVLSPSEKLKSISGLIERLFPQLIGQDTELDTILSELGTSGGNETSGLVEAQGMVDDRLLAKLVSTDNSCLAALKSLHADLLSSSAPPKPSVASYISLAAYLGPLSKLLALQDQRGSADVAELACQCTLLCVGLRLQLSRHPNGVVPSVPYERDEFTFFESGVLAASTLLQMKSESTVARHWSSILEAEHTLRNTTDRLHGNRKIKIVLALSNLQWRMYQYMLKLDERDMDKAESLLAASVDGLKTSGITTQDRNIWHYSVKLNAHIRFCLKRAPSMSAAHASQYYTAARTSILQLFRHWSKQRIEKAGSSFPNPNVHATKTSTADQVDDDGLDLAFTAVIRYTEQSRHPLIEAIVNTVAETDRMTVLQRWIAAPKDLDRRALCRELSSCYKYLLALKLPAAKQLDICWQVLSQALSNPACLPISIQDAAIELGDSEHAKLSTMQDSQSLTSSSAWSLAKAAHEQNALEGTFEDHLKSLLQELAKLKPSGSAMDALVDLMQSLCGMFELNNWTALQALTHDISEILIHDSTPTYTVRSLYVRTSRARYEISCCRLDSAAASLDQAMSNIGTAVLPLRLRALMALVDLDLSCAYNDTDKIQTSLKRCASLLNLDTKKRNEKIIMYRFHADVNLVLGRFYLSQGIFLPCAGLLQSANRLLKSIAASSKQAKTSVEGSLEDATQALADMSLSPNDTSENGTHSGIDDAGTPPDITVAIIHCLLLQHQLAVYLGVHREASRHIREAEEVSNKLALPHIKHLVQTQSLRFEIHQSKREDAEDSGHVVDAPGTSRGQAGPNPTVSALHLALGDWRMNFETGDRALKEYQIAESLLGILPSDTPVKAVNTTRLTAAKSRTKQPVVTSARTRIKISPTTKKAAPVSRSVAKRGNVKQGTQASPLPPLKISPQLLASIRRQKGLAYLNMLDVKNAVHLLHHLQSTGQRADDASLAIAQARLELARARNAIDADLTFGTLPESTLAIPACQTATTGSSSQDDGRVASVASEDSVPVDDHTDVLPGSLIKAKRLLSRGINESIATNAINVARQMTQLTMTSSLILSAMDPGKEGRLHPCALSWSLELPDIEATTRLHEYLAHDKSKKDPDFVLLPICMRETRRCAVSAYDFQKRYIDILPATWTTVSVCMNEDATELWLARYHCGEVPFVLRLPMARKSEDQLAETESFTFPAAIAELRDIIEASDYSCHHPPDLSAKGGKGKWWEDREALDQRLQALLTSVEDMWLGGFKSIFSLHERHPDLLARFRKSVNSVLDRHLPSRQGKQVKKSRLVLHSHILDLCIGLDISREAEDKLDEDVMDLLYFIVDTLQWNGEPNAHDEIDFDAMTIETIDAIRSYHGAASARPSSTDESHLILRLDKRLHHFPWESLPCLQNKSISRVASLAQLRDRILHMRRSCPSPHQNDRYIVPRANGTALLNPSSDLVRTETTLAPLLAPLQAQHDWRVTVRHKPSEQDFSAALTGSSTLLYFGHGSGTQYIRERAIQRLPRCADVVWLMGCSSGKVETWGQLESESVPLSYLLAGEDRERSSSETSGKVRQGMCMSVVATLWDVTDRDIDAFSVSAGRRWGLFGERKAAAAAATASEPGKGLQVETAQVVPKTPGRKARAPKTPAKTPAVVAVPARTTVRRNTKKKVVEGIEEVGPDDGRMSLASAVARSRDVCYLRYLNGAASVVYGIPAYLGD